MLQTTVCKFTHLNKHFLKKNEYFNHGHFFIGYFDSWIRSPWIFWFRYSDLNLCTMSTKTTIKCIFFKIFKKKRRAFCSE